MQAVEARVVLIEDERVVSRSIETSLNAAGSAVIATADSEDGLRIIERERARLNAVLAEAAIPNISGYEICRVLAEFHPELPVMLLSRASASSRSGVSTSPAAVPPAVDPRDLDLVSRRLREIIQGTSVLAPRVAAAHRAASETILESRRLWSERV